ncbi:signal transduction histidine kinase [Promicromonospora sp. AC04]|uniref:sensor histidine kinase n=1 Tax=Promicromonospora sp. AC04 TaxID=2135723 RepID=UPI000D4271F3|nr:sensor histidine kinase [Promicromonospora sp. AC04]PUB23409.1 signal transduction histidine kinase [Promicromonospora sp. AC04]
MPEQPEHGAAPRPHVVQPRTVDPRVTDVVLALAMALVVAVVIAADTDTVRRTGTGAYLFAAGFGALVLLRRKVPRTVVVVTVLGVFAYYILELSPIGMALPAVAALYSAAEMRHTGWAIGGGLVLIAVSTYYRTVGNTPEEYLAPYDLVTNVALVAAAVALGVAVRLSREARGHEARAAGQRLQAERLRIARDLHDVVGHNLSVIALHSGVAAEAVGRNDDAARRALEHVREATSGTLRELRSTVRVLRGPVGTAPGTASQETTAHGTAASDAAEPDAASHDAAAPKAPAPTGLAGIDALARSARAAGLAVDVAVDVPAGALDGAIDAAAYRITQESLTNVLRHAAATRVTVSARVTGGRLALRVADDGRGAGPDLEPGSGISGMRERVALLGGGLTAADAPDGGFVVTADLPLRLEE